MHHEIPTSHIDFNTIDFDTEILTHRKSLFLTAMRYTKNEGDADDLVQDTFLKAYQNIDKFKKGSNARSWLTTILTHNFINKYRRKKREREILAGNNMRVIRENFHDIRTLEIQQNPEQRAIFNSFGEEMQNALNKIPEAFRTVIVLAGLNDFSYKEIAEILECPVGTVMSRVSRGRQLLRDELQGYAQKEGILKAA